jgi:hypothetical protein
VAHSVVSRRGRRCRALFGLQLLHSQGTSAVDSRSSVAARDAQSCAAWSRVILKWEHLAQSAIVEIFHASLPTCSRFVPVSAMQERLAAPATARELPVSFVSCSSQDHISQVLLACCYRACLCFPRLPLLQVAFMSPRMTACAAASSTVHQRRDLQPALLKALRPVLTTPNSLAFRSTVYTPQLLEQPHSGHQQAICLPVPLPLSPLFLEIPIRLPADLRNLSMCRLSRL